MELGPECQLYASEFEAVVARYWPPVAGGGPTAALDPLLPVASVSYQVTC